MILGLDTATPATAAAAWRPGTDGVEQRDDPGPGERPRHAERLLVLLEAALAGAGGTWEDVARLAVGVGPGGFTGLRLGIATARALAQARGLPLAPVSSLEALAAGARGAAGGRPVAAVIDARRGEAFAAAWDGDALSLPPAAYSPDDLAARLPAGALAAGDGAVRFRSVLEAAGATVPADGDPAHRVSALWVCRLGATVPTAGRDELLPDYRREPDAVPPRPR